MSPEAVSPLRRRMIEDMAIRQFGEHTKRDYIRQVREFTAFLGRSPDQAEPEDLRRYQLHLTSLGASYARMNLAATALRFFFHVTLGRSGFGDRMARIPSPERLPVVLSPEEVALLLAHAPSLKYRAALSVAYGCGLRVSEIANLKVADIDSARMLIRVEQGKGRKDRFVMLSPDLLEPARARIPFERSRTRRHHRCSLGTCLPLLWWPPRYRGALPSGRGAANASDRHPDRHVMIAAPSTIAITDRCFAGSPTRHGPVRAAMALLNMATTLIAARDPGHGIQVQPRSRPDGPGSRPASAPDPSRRHRPTVEFPQPLQSCRRRGATAAYSPGGFRTPALSPTPTLASGPASQTLHMSGRWLTSRKRTFRFAPLADLTGPPSCRRSPATGASGRTDLSYASGARARVSGTYVLAN